MRLPPTRIRPWWERTSPEIARRVVLLPAPLGPSTATTAPWGTVRVTPRRAWTPP